MDDVCSSVSFPLAGACIWEPRNGNSPSVKSYYLLSGRSMTSCVLIRHPASSSVSIPPPCEDDTVTAAFVFIFAFLLGTSLVVSQHQSSFASFLII